MGLSSGGDGGTDIVTQLEPREVQVSYSISAESRNLSGSRLGTRYRFDGVSIKWRGGIRSLYQ